MCFDFLYNFCLKHFLFQEEFNDMSQMHVGLHGKYLLLLSDFNENWILPTDFSKNTQTSNFMIIRPVWAELFHVIGQTNRQTMTKLTSLFLILQTRSKS